jgi:hypothetical protein
MTNEDHHIIPFADGIITFSRPSDSFVLAFFMMQSLQSPKVKVS